MTSTEKRIYFIRHGIAADRTDYERDADRPLTEEGFRKTRQIARRLEQLGLHFDRLLTSPLTRARQTAEILQEQGLSDTLEEYPHLKPAGNFQQWLHWYRDWQPSTETHLALVGHEPDLGHWVEQLVFGDIGDRLAIKKAGIVGTIVPSTGSPVGNSLLFWLTPPKLLL
ncbi:phosphohistidine phosphatase SixA [Oxynema sp. CENA135]|uniref:phosphohistidine phosphatase SixA n=1 Tax=Oxynema sp. CENA135 TaxID=984206 RepID=UPI00190A6EE8|nr:phosphohistidine phosphatase SixA [Oxynema sp. CENA135]MBK4729885.1 phosphohistidine phosphatase SixA [Oxynema sp. CENA135]